jgi:TM2 domain-containing membrane protein YozV
MKKVLFTFLALAVITASTNAAIVQPGTTDPQPISSTMTFEQFVKMTPQEFEKASGKKMNFLQKKAFKVAQKTMAKKAKAAAAGKSQIAATLLCWLVGILGIHRFYLGYTWQGIVQLLTLGGLGIWALIDLIRIIIGDLQPKDGEYEKTF